MNRILKSRTFKTTVIAAAAVGVVGVAQARDQVRIVGSSTVYPFASYVAEEFGATTEYPTPVIESTGSGGGLRLFCNGVGDDTPDITNASRRMKPSEFERCEENGVTDITEAFIGYDGIAFAQSGENDAMPVTREQIFLALAAQVPVDGELVDNPYTQWSDIDESLPDRKIAVYGPPTTSGTRDAFEELVMEAASEDMEAYGEAYTDIRSDGAYIDAGENDNLIVQRLAENKDAFGIFGYSFLEENSDSLIGSSIDGVKPTPEAIGSGEYPVSRSLFFYVKNQHAENVPPMYEYANMFMSEQMIGDMGYLKGIGLIPAPQDMREEARNAVESKEQLELADLK
ncbi:PstS family phosphate ABC transporter substrate-binding protein [Halomonas elongata]|uniref:ABC-type transport system periplasmic substrate-binding protein n=1 Tax=Halomonas elongata (strain ATCC 33173 / DSM 2581 / NBRC 15536 / NCIMB 2198 / 1H9) TaxID=768066 RepID=E1VAG4_HALED|nr:PstS family phosphate ABC transporter substrate-binding protein [Halomonas elongata]MBW5798686.1 PstS family phosphate ABC transporter substrate-binding protein [Halomonas elongata]MDL4863747.1 PstS family phosphate ABC transporter substrate-binding protein [Halomonas elongata]WBF19274.1 PstS family phosphate ABC transporter substrate-binding protein [Halomonas elongata]WPU48134.1 PstS family phosphate ABC transporter substrate-binding protein [Halomonas elongata DSM 2581]WVI72732.1 PstS fa